MKPLSPTPRSTPTRKRNRTVLDRQALHDVLDAGLICHLGLVLDGSPVVLPTAYGRDGNVLYLHGSTGARSLRAAADGAAVCVTVTHLDGIVYARSVNNHSMNYRSAVVHGIARQVDEPHAKMHALRVVTEHLAPGSWDHARRPSAKEFAAVSVLALPLDEASVKIRAEGPGDAAEDIEADRAWAGVLPVQTTFGEPRWTNAHPLPDHVRIRGSAANPPSDHATVIAADA